MNIGEKLLELRKNKHLSQEEVADKLNVTRQTISKWETGSSTPDFDKIAPLCKLYEISADELLTGVKKDEEQMPVVKEVQNSNTKERAKGIGISIFLYFISVAWLMISIPVLRINPIVSTAIFLIICGIATYLIIYTSIVYKKPEDKKEKTPSIAKQINEIISIIFLIIYLLISFTTMAWHITWIIWVVYALVAEIIKLIFMLRGGSNEK